MCRYFHISKARCNGQVIPTLCGTRTSGHSCGEETNTNMKRRCPLYEFSLICALFVGGIYPEAPLAHGTVKSDIVTDSSEGIYDPKSTGTRKIALGDVTIRMLIDKTNVGRDDIEIGELIIPVGSPDSVSHAHGSLEIFYVVEGILGHEVNGRPYTLNPGEIGYLKPGDKVIHRVLSDLPVKALVIWVPGGESDSLVEHAGFVEVPWE